MTSNGNWSITPPAATRQTTGIRSREHDDRKRNDSMSVAEKFASMEYGPAPEDAKDALLWLDQHQRKFAHFIGGEWRQPVENVFFDSINPATGEKLAAIAQGSAADIDAAVRCSLLGRRRWQAGTPP